MTAAHQKTMNIEEVRQVISMLPTEFDSHKFILCFLQFYPRSYGELLMARNNVAFAHGDISNYIRLHMGELHLEELEKRTSPDIFGNPSLNAQWRKL